MLHKTDEVYCDEDEDDFDEGKEGQKGLGVSYTDCQWGEGSAAAAAAAGVLLFSALLLCFTLK